MNKPFALLFCLLFALLISPFSLAMESRPSSKIFSQKFSSSDHLPANELLPQKRYLSDCGVESDDSHHSDSKSEGSEKGDVENKKIAGVVLALQKKLSTQTFLAFPWIL